MKKIILFAAVLLLTSFAANSATYTVASTADTGSGSLRAAIDSSNAHPGLDTISLTLATSDTIYLASPLDTITDSLLITGLACSNPTINGGSLGFSGSALYVSVTGIPLSISYVNFAGCNNVSALAKGGAINADILNLSYCYFFNNSAIDNSGDGYCAGGAIAANYVTATNCTFVDNVVGDNSGDAPFGEGGAVYADSTVNLYNCTFYFNQSDAFGTAVYAQNITGANVVNCTFSNNRPVPGAVSVSGALYVNLPSPYTSANYRIADNIVWGNTAVGPKSGIVFANGTIRSVGCNLMQSAASNSNFTINLGDDQGLNPLLGVFGYHGGCVPVITLKCGSPAQNHATCAGATATDARGVAASGARDAGAFELPEYIPRFGPNIVQCGGSVTLSATPSSVSIDTYRWTTGATTSSIVASTSGYYHVAVTDTFGCISSDSITLYIVPRPYVNLGPDTTLCSNVPLSLNAGNPGDVYHWSTTQTTQTITVGSAGTYTVTVTDPNSVCTVTGSLNVSFLAAPVITLSPSLRQCGGMATLDAGNQGLGAAYNWSAGSNSQTQPVATSGTYSVTVTNSQTCSASAFTDVYIEPAPYVNLGNDTTNCGGPVILNAGNPGYLYHWSNNTTTQTIAATTTNTYSVTVRNPNSLCSATGSVNVTILPLPVINLGPDVTQCGGSVTLFAGNEGSTYVWSNDSTTPSIVATAPGLYGVTVTNPQGCSASSAVHVYIQTVPSVYLGPDVTQCGGSVRLDAGNPAGFGYLWSTADTTQSIQAAVTNTYIVTVTNLINGCKTADTIHVTIDTIPVVNMGPDTTQCGGSVTLNAGNAGAMYLWSDNSTAQTLLVTASGIYRVTVTNSNGCMATGSITVTIHPIPVVTLSLPQNVCITVPPFALTGGLPVGGTYFEADTALSVFNPTAQGIGAHQITYLFTNNFGCTDSASASVFVRPQPALTSNSLPFLCTTSSEINLNNYFNPSGGVYTGIGTSGNYFYPGLVPAGMDTLVDVYTDNFGCMDTLKYPVQIHRPVHVSLTSSVADFTICKGQSITFNATGAEFYQFFVNDSAQGAVSTDSVFTTTILTNHSFVHVVGSNPCSTDTSEPMVIDVITPPVVSAGSDTTINLGQTVVLNGVANGNGSLTYLWTPGNGLNFINVPDPTYSGSDSITFTLRATDSYGCYDSAQVSVYVYVPDNVKLPTVITPNGDGFNDVWKLNAKINLDGSHLVIFDRWGQVVYECDNYANNWGGTYKGTGQLLPDDTYYFVLKVPAQHNHVYEGPINIISSGVK